MTRKEFNKECKIIIEKIINENEYFANIVSSYGPGWGVGQYKNVIHWYRVLFKKKNYIKYNDKIIIGFHIMPYQITEDIMISAKMKYGNNIENSNEPFNIEIEKNNNYVDYDPDASNFHKSIDYNYQIVLLDKSTIGHLGPAAPTSNIKFIDNKKEFINEVKKEKMYYPNINEKNKHITNIKDIEILVNNVLKELK